MEIDSFLRKLPKVELHAHLNGSLSRSTMLELQRYYADSGMTDNMNAFFDEFEMAAGDPRSFSDCFQVFRIAHNLTTTPSALEIALFSTLKEFQDDGCCYIELRSTPRDTQYMSKRQYIDTLVKSIRTSPQHLTIITRLIISICRHSPLADAEEIADLAIEFYKSYPDIVVGIDFSGNPTVGSFKDFVPALSRAREAGLKVTLHCGEVFNPSEVQEMLEFKPERIGHGTCIHPKYRGTDETWVNLCKSRIPVELCLTSNVNSKSISDYDSHHFKYYYTAGIPLVICTDDKGVFSTSLSHEYKICAETFHLEPSKLAELSLKACDYIFAEDMRTKVKEIISNFVQKNC
ncbi:adenosine deaminase-like protein [Pectinophora gossypiella]|uniref:adenosine deaminase-like protein n=1 Tax=Pectinophora gossypiella TaxID=13191 RepID=UPI00214E9C2B|nr:adenosine deaminase-like protein [Pectinophora gossypiella]